MKILFISFSVLILLVYLPAKAKEYQVKFDCSSKSFPKQRKIIDKLALEERKFINEAIASNLFPSLKKWEVCIDEFDLNNDNKKELFAYFPMSPYCGSAGCLTKIFTKNSEWKEIYNATTYGDFNIQNEYSEGFKTIKIRAKILCGEKNNCFHKNKHVKEYFDNTILKTLKFNSEKQMYAP